MAWLTQLPPEHVWLAVQVFCSCGTVEVEQLELAVPGLLQVLIKRFWYTLLPWQNGEPTFVSAPHCELVVQATVAQVPLLQVWLAAQVFFSFGAEELVQVEFTVPGLLQV